MTTSSSPHRNALATGYELHWYTIDQVLGQGGFGITYVAHDNNLAQRVAIKEYLPSELALRGPDRSVHPNSADSEETYRWGLERFIDEGRTLARFDHPNIVRVLAVFEAHNTAYLVMRYEEGTTLADALRGRATLDEDRLLAILLPLLDGLEHVHTAGFIHRDIKPANIFLRGDSGPVLIDFGSARQALGHHTRTLTTLVSPGYAPFEQYSNRSDEQGPWTDIYALAATMYRGLAGVSPPDAVDRSHRLHNDEADPLVPALEAGAGRYSPAFLAAVDWGLGFKRQDRPPAIAAWRDALGSEHATLVREETTVRNPVHTELLAVRFDVDAPTEILDAPGSGDPGPTSEAAPVPAPRPRRWHLVAVPGLVVGLGLAVALSHSRSSPPVGPAGSAGPASSSQRAAAAAPAHTATAPTPASASNAPVPEPEAASGVDALLAKARRHAAAGHTLSPPGRNAFEAYRTALARDSTSEDARDGLRALVKTEIGDVVDAVARQNFDRAEEKLARLTELLPGSERLANLRDRVRGASQASR